MRRTQSICEITDGIDARDQGLTQAQWRARNLEEAKERMLAGAGFPRRALDLVRAGGLIETPALQGVRENQASMLILAGDAGSGKTVAACAREVAVVVDSGRWHQTDYPPWLEGGAVLFLTAAALVRWPRFEHDAMDRLLSSGGLVVDDVGAEALDQAGWARSLIDEVIDNRYSGGGRLTITTNLQPATFAARYGERVMDRIREAGRWLGCGAVSLRRAVASGGRPC